MKKAIITLTLTVFLTILAVKVLATFTEYADNYRTEQDALLNANISDSVVR